MAPQSNFILGIKYIDNRNRDILSPQVKDLADKYGAVENGHPRYPESADQFFAFTAERQCDMLYEHLKDRSPFNQGIGAYHFERPIDNPSETGEQGGLEGMDGINPEN